MAEPGIPTVLTMPDPAASLDMLTADACAPTEYSAACTLAVVNHPATRARQAMMVLEHAIMRIRIVFFLLLLCGCLSGCSRLPTDPNATSWHLRPGTVVPYSTPAFRQGRLCWVYLPPGYTLTRRVYPVVYMHDGEIAFDGPHGMHVNRICDNLIANRSMQPVIVVAITNTPGRRVYDYTPWASDSSGQEGGGASYVLSIVDSLIPAVEHDFRAISNKESRAMVGASLGGLISVYATYAHPAVFGKVGAFSPTYGATSYAVLHFVD